jgi:uncharacterized protein (TIGR02444 family)
MSEPAFGGTQTASGRGLWEFSLAIYAEPGVSEACLELQDQAGADVPTLLYAVWVAARGRRVDPEVLNAMIPTVNDWSKAVIQPLRLARRNLKERTNFGAGAPDLRQAVKSQELAAERILIEVISSKFPPEVHRDEAGDFILAARANVAEYRSQIGANFDDACVDTICRAAERYVQHDFAAEGNLNR